MNGEVNGTMEEAAKTPITESLENVNNIKALKSEEYENGTLHCEESNCTENSNHLENDCSGQELDSNLEYIVNDSNGSCQQQVNSESENIHNNTTPDSNKLSPQYSGNELDTNCNISNDSYPESLNSTRIQNEVTDQHDVTNIEEKSKDSETNLINNDGIQNVQDLYEEDTSNEVSEIEPRAEDTVSLDTDSEPDANDDTSQESSVKLKHNDMTLQGSDRVIKNRLITTEIHEIDSDNDDSIGHNEEKKAIPNKRDSPVPLRRSSRAIKRKRYTDDLDNCEDDSDIEEVVMREAYKGRCKPIVINDTKALVEMASRQMKVVHNQNQKKEPTVVIIDTNSSNLPEKLPSKAFGLSIKYNTPSNPNVYHKIQCYSNVPSGSNKHSLNNAHTPQQSILPSLTDDMFVVEAPSFIVPYVYEKPSFKPFREFVDILGKELEEQKAKADKDLLEKQKAEKEKREKEKIERREKGEEVEDTEEEIDKDQTAAPESSNTDLEEKKNKKLKSDKKDRRKQNKDDDDMSWDGESSAESDDDIISDEEGKTIIIKEKDDPIEDIKDVTALIAEKVCSTKSDNYFDCSLGKFFIDIGLNLVQEYVQSDLLKQQNRKLYREKKSGHNTKLTETSIASLSKNIEFSKENNAPYKFKYKKCEFCSFKTESMLALAHHLETPHMKNNLYKCNFCAFEIRSPHDILYHMEVEHKTRGKLERAPAYHQCANCPFEDNGKGKLARHLIPCAKKFKPEVNLSPPIEWEPPAKIPKISRARNHMMGGQFHNSFGRTQIGTSINRPSMSMTNMVSGMTSPSFRPRVKVPMQTPSRPLTPMVRGSVIIKQTAPVLMSPSFIPKGKSVHQPSISITPLPRQPQPVQQHHHPSQVQNKGTFVICEICDGYIKDLEQLRNHMQWIHKVKIHPKMIYNRPPLNCQKCQFRFFTDQGLERHLLGSHGLVTSSMQEAANKGKDAGRCPVCGRVYQWKLLNHVGRDHNLTLKPAHLSYKCTVCTATFGMYKQFENHVYSAHSVVAKRVMDKNKATVVPQKANTNSLLKPLKINDEITIIPQPNKTSTSVKDK